MGRLNITAFVATLAGAAIATTPMLASEDIAAAINTRLGAEYNLGWFENIGYKAKRRKVKVSAEGPNINLDLVYAYDGEILGEVIKYELSTSDDPAIVMALMGEAAYAELMDGRAPTDISFDMSCEDGECEVSFDASGSGFDMSFDRECDMSGCEYDFDMSDDAMEAAIEAEEEARDEAEDAADDAKDREEDAKDREEDANDD